MRRLLFYFLKTLAWLSRIFRSRSLYMAILVLAHKTQGVKFSGNPRYIHSDAMLDALGGLTIGERVVISPKVTILSHDYAYTVGLLAAGETLTTDISFRAPVELGKYCFIGSGTILLPGTKLGDFCVVGAGSVVKGEFPAYSLLAGDPAKRIGDTREWGAALPARFSPSLIRDKK